MFGFGKFDKEKALIKALSKGYLLKGPELIPRIGDPNYVAKNGLTALLAVTQLRSYQGAWSTGKTMGLCVEVVRELLKNGADPNICDQQGRSPLMNAAIDGNSSAFKSLLENGADMNQKDRNKRDALMHAATWGNFDIVITLLKKGVYADSADTQGETPLMMVVFHNEDGRGMLTALQMLLECRIDTNRVSDANQTAVTIAMDNNNPTTVKTLLESGANADVKNRWGKNTMQWATDNGYREIVDILQSKTESLEAELSSGDKVSANDKIAIELLGNICQAYAKNDTATYQALEHQVKQIGERLDREGGIARMRKFFGYVEDQPGARTLEMLWNGIGEWRG